MGLKKFFKKQLATVIEWKPQQPDILLYRYPSVTDEIKDASKLLVSPGQGCILVYEGKVTDILTEPGLYSLETDNHPFITNLVKIYQSFNSEHKMHLYFYRSAEVLNQPWGTPTQIKYMDSVYQIPIEMGAYGNYSYKLTDARRMFEGITGTMEMYSTQSFRQVMQARIPQIMVSYLAQQKLSYQQIDAHLSAISEALFKELADEFSKMGVEMLDFRLQGTSFDEATLERIGKIADITAEAKAAQEGGLSYTELEKLRALRDAAKNEGGIAGAGLHLGAGLELGKTFIDKAEDGASKETSGEDPVKILQKLKLLLDEGIISQEEFDEKKKEVLSRM